MSFKDFGSFFSLIDRKARFNLALKLLWLSLDVFESADYGEADSDSLTLENWREYSSA